MERRELSAYGLTVGQLGEQLRRAEVDAAAFGVRLRACELADCRANCCHDGVVLGGEEVEGISALVAEETDWFAGSGWGFLSRLFEESGGRWKTATRAASEGEVAEDYPAHFARTRCVFLDGRHRCVLQRLAVERGQPAWYWKPVSCWMHPLVLRSAKQGGVPVLTIPSPADDAARFGSCTHCGRPDAGGQSARQVLAEELAMLRAVAGRDFAAELAAGEAGGRGDAGGH